MEVKTLTNIYSNKYNWLLVLIVLRKSTGIKTPNIPIFREIIKCLISLMTCRGWLRNIGACSFDQNKHVDISDISGN